MAETAMVVSYGADDMAAAQKKRNTFLICFIILSLAVVAGVAVMAVIRNLFLTILLSIVGGGAMIFVWDIAGAPVVRYMRFLKDQTRGLTHTYAGTFIEWGAVNVRDGLPFRELLLDMDGEPLQFFLDAKKEQPALNPGNAVEIVTHNKAVISMKLRMGN